METPVEITRNKDCLVEDRRLWIGNLDPRVTEYHLLKLVQKYGAIEKFDLIFHRIGPFIGQPRGYAFVTYCKKDDAVVAKTALNNLLVGQRVINVTWAHTINNDDGEKKEEIFIPALAMSKSENKADRTTQIQAIEAKLKMMEKKQEEELKINDTVATKTPVIVQYQQKVQTVSGHSNNKHHFKKRERYRKPYSKNNKYGR